MIDGILNKEGEESHANNQLIRVLLQIIEVPDSPEELVGVGMHMYPDEVFYVTRDIIPVKYLDGIKQGDYFIARGNVTTKYLKDLYFTEFDPAPEPDPNDGLA